MSGDRGHRPDPKTQYLFLIDFKKYLVFTSDDHPRRTALSEAAKTHRGVRAQFSRLAQHESRIDAGLLTFLGEGYQLKAVVDYGVGQAMDSITSDDAASAVVTTGRFVDCMAAVLG